MRTLVLFICLLTSHSAWSQYEQKVGLTQRPESDIFAALNPIDTANLVVSAVRYNPLNPGETPILPVYVSQDGGQNWIETPFRGDIPGGQISDKATPSLAFDHEGKLHLTWTVMKNGGLTFQGSIGIFYAFSDNGGLNWQVNNQPIANGMLQFVGNGFSAVDRYVDRAVLAADQTAGSFRGHVYCLYQNREVLPFNQRSIQCLRKSRSQNDFSGPSVQVNTHNYADIRYPAATVDGEGRLHVIFWASPLGNDYALYHCRSEDGGETFSAEKMISPVSFALPSTANDFHVSNLSGVLRFHPSAQIAVDQSGGPHDGNVYVSWTGRGLDSMLSDAYDIYLARSTDQGESWSIPQIANQDQQPLAQQYFAGLAVSGNGTLALSWYDRRADPANRLTHYYLTESVDGGQSFVQERKLSSEAADFFFANDQNQGFGVGSRTHLLATPNKAIAFWADGRENNGRLRLYTNQSVLRPAIATGLIDPIQTELRLYPNPARELIYLDMSVPQFGQATVQLIHPSGQVFLPALSTQNGLLAISVRDLPKGLYILQWQTDQEVLRRKVLISHDTF